MCSLPSGGPSAGYVIAVAVPDASFFVTLGGRGTVAGKKTAKWGAKFFRAEKVEETTSQ